MTEMGFYPTKVDSIEYNGYIVELHHNPMIKIKPYLIRVYSWHDDPYEYRAEHGELAKFSEIINNLIEENE